MKNVSTNLDLSEHQASEAAPFEWHSDLHTRRSLSILNSRTVSGGLKLSQLRSELDYRSALSPPEAEIVVLKPQYPFLTWIAVCEQCSVAGDILAGESAASGPAPRIFAQICGRCVSPLHVRQPVFLGSSVWIGHSVGKFMCQLGPNATTQRAISHLSRLGTPVGAGITFALRD